MKIATIVGARPQFIKAAVVSGALAAQRDVDELLIHTGQHYDNNLSDVFFQELGIPTPTFNLGVGSASPGRQTAEMLLGIEEVLLRERPDCVLVYGDTNSTLAGALAATKLHIPLAHVEAGLRSFNHQMPEEINRVLTDHCSDLLFAPTPAAAANLHREGIELGVHVTGDVMYDAALRYAELADAHSHILATLQLIAVPYVLVTIHRAENTDSQARLRIIVDSLAQIAGRIVVILPLHPRTRRAASAFGISLEREGLIAVDPVGYLDMTMLEKHARAIVTDSGGVQREAFFHHVPCVILRHETEWAELVASGWSRLAPPDSSETVVTAVEAALVSRPRFSEALFGDGHAADKIVSVLLRSTVPASLTEQPSGPAHLS